MGFWHTEAAYSADAGGPGAKSVLVCLGNRACDTCGLAWPGVAYLSARTEIPEKRVSAHLSALLKAGLIAVHGYGKGGRGRSTEYIVLPQVTKLSTAPCAKCAKLKETPSPRGGFRATNPPVSDAETPPPRTPHQSGINQTAYQSAKPREETPPKPPGGSKARLAPDGHGQASIPTESLDFLKSLGLHPTPPSEGKPANNPQKPETGQGRKPGNDSQGVP